MTTCGVRAGRPRRAVRVLVGLALVAGALGGCAKTYNPAEFAALEKQTERAMERLNEKERDLQPAIDAGIAHAVFPTIGQASVYGVGLAIGDGIVYQNGEVLGVARYSELSIGPQGGGSAGSRVLIFNSPESLAEFTDGVDFMVGAESAAIAGSRGASAATDAKSDATTFRSPIGGFMLHATVKAGTYRYRPIEEAIRE